MSSVDIDSEGTVIRMDDVTEHLPLEEKMVQQVVEAGYDAVCVEGDGDLADICRLTCLEQKLRVAPEGDESRVPTLVAEGTRLALRWPEKSRGNGVK